MPSSANQNKASQQNTRSSQDVETKSKANPQNQSSEKNFDLIKYLNENQHIIQDRYGYGKSSKVRCPHYYFVNNKNTTLIILQGDITRTKVDAIVNAANEHMTGGGGVDGVIHRAAGSELYKACTAHKQIYPGVRLPIGHSRILLSYNMSSTTNYIINTSGPVYSQFEAKQCAEDLTSCYETALNLANLYDLESIAFTAISCGIFGYPAIDGANVALGTVDKHAGSIPIVVFVLWDDGIYDTWVKIAKHMNFEEFDILNIPKVHTSDDDGHDHQKVTENVTTKDDDQPKSPITTHEDVRDLSKQDTGKSEPDNELQDMITRLPSVPDHSSDTQQTAEMENSTQIHADQHLHTQQTAEMTSPNADVPETVLTQTNSVSEDSNEGSSRKQ